MNFKFVRNDQLGALLYDRLNLRAGRRRSSLEVAQKIAAALHNLAEEDKISPKTVKVQGNTIFIEDKES